MMNSFKVAILTLAMTTDSIADDATTDKWIKEFQPSVLSKVEQKAEINWFIEASQPYKGMEINVVSETIATHEYEAKTLAAAFTELTGIKITHDLIG